MARLNLMGWVRGAIFGFLIQSALVVNVPAEALRCAPDHAALIPKRSATATPGSAFVKAAMGLSGELRDQFVSAELLAGNIPPFLKNLTPVTFVGTLPDGRAVNLTICVTPDYLAVGNDSDFVRVPMGLPAAAGIADRFGFLLPTTRMVDAIHAQAKIRLKPSPMQPTSQMSSTEYFWRHNHAIDGQRAGYAHRLDELTAGHKKDLVLSNRLRSASGHVAIYGWHRQNGRPIQPLSTVHGAGYADYSHGLRLVSATAFVNGVAQPLAAVLQDPLLAPIVSSEGPIADPHSLQASLHDRWIMADSAKHFPTTARR